MLECPRCKSNAVMSINGNLLCLHCGNSEALEDYPIAVPHHEPVKELQEAEEGIVEQLEKVQSQVNVLMGQEVYRQKTQHKKGSKQLTRIEI